MAEKEKPTPAPKSEKPETVETTVREIRRATRKKYSAEEKIRIVLEGLRGETGVRELCRREGIPTNLYYTWSKEFLEAGKQRLVGDTSRQAGSREVADLRSEVEQLKQLVAELALKNRVLTPALALRASAVPGKKACWARKRRGKTNTCTCAARKRGASVRRSATEKREIIELVEHSALSTNKTLAELSVARSTFYTWCKQYRAQGAAGLEPRTSTPRQFPLALPLRGSAGASVEPDPGPGQ